MRDYYIPRANPETDKAETAKNLAIGALTGGILLVGGAMALRNTNWNPLWRKALLGAVGIGSAFLLADAQPAAAAGAGIAGGIAVLGGVADQAEIMVARAQLPGPGASPVLPGPGGGGPTISGTTTNT